jgi:Protein of unknown function (DUF3168)
MALSAGLALQKMMVARLKADSGVSALVGARIYDAVPQGVAFPFIEISSLQEIDDGSAGLVQSVEVFVDLNIWTRPEGGPSSVQAQAVAEAVKQSLHIPSALPDLADGWALSLIERRSTRLLGDPDGATARAVVTLRALIDKG